jgi:hypothetical protein
MLEKLALFVAALIAPQLIWAQHAVLEPPYFNIANNRKITANATCGEGGSRIEVYCSLNPRRIGRYVLNGKVIVFF